MQKFIYEIICILHNQLQCVFCSFTHLASTSIEDAHCTCCYFLGIPISYYRQFSRSTKSYAGLSVLMLDYQQCMVDLVDIIKSDSMVPLLYMNLHA
jgi:hypothetical protein